MTGVLRAGGMHGGVGGVAGDGVDDAAAADGDAGVVVHVGVAVVAEVVADAGGGDGVGGEVLAGICSVLGVCGFMAAAKATFYAAFGPVVGAFSPFTAICMLISPEEYASSAFGMVNGIYSAGAARTKARSGSGGWWW